jgi:hypothetical protein
LNKNHDVTSFRLDVAMQCADVAEAFRASFVHAKGWRMLQINATDTFVMLLKLSICCVPQLFFSAFWIAIFSTVSHLQP